MLNTRQLGGTHLSHEIFFWQGKESTQVRDAYSAPPKHCIVPASICSMRQVWGLAWPTQSRSIAET